MIHGFIKWIFGGYALALVYIGTSVVANQISITHALDNIDVQNVKFAYIAERINKLEINETAMKGLIK